MTFDAKKQRENIEKVRGILNPVEVKLDKWPVWFKKRFKEKTGKPFSWTSGAETHMVCEAAGVRNFFDHWGTSKVGEEIFLISEPYASTEDFLSAIQFAKFYDLKIRIYPNSFWYPGSTTRIEFSEKKNAPEK